MDSIDPRCTLMYDSRQDTQLDETNFLKMLEQIKEISFIINQGHTLEKTLSSILDKVLKIAGMECGGIYHKDSITGDYILSVYSNLHKRIELKKSIQQHWESFLPIMKEKVIAIPDADHFSEDGQNQIFDNNFRSFLAIPLIKENINYGTIVTSSPNANEFSEIQKRIFSIIGMQVAGYIHNSNLIAQLTESKQMYYELFNNAQDMIYTHDLDGNFLTINQAGLDILGYSLEEILQMNFGEFLTEESVDTASEVVRLFKKNVNISVQPVFEIVNKKRDKKFLECNLRTLFENGKPVAIHGIARDVNKRLQAEKNMLIFTNTINLAKDGIDISDSEHKISFINESGARIFGYSRRELLGQPVNIFYAEEDLPNLEENIIPSIEKFGYWNGLILGRKKDGSAIPIEINLSSVMDENRKPLVNIGVFREAKSNISN